jgi:hypothetical protein
MQTRAGAVHRTARTGKKKLNRRQQRKQRSRVGNQILRFLLLSPGQSPLPEATIASGRSQNRSGPFSKIKRDLFLKRLFELQFTKAVLNRER